MATARPSLRTTHTVPRAAGLRLRRGPLGLQQVFWADWRLGVAVTLAIAAAVGLATALVMPRGPDTSAQALGLLINGLGIGVVIGLVTRSRWAMPLAPAATLAAFELGRRSTDGPLVDGVRLDYAFGVVALILGRGFFVLVALVPMALGVAYGAGIARRLGSPSRRPGHRIGFWVRRLGGGLTTAGVISLAVMIAWPASSPPVLGADGEEIPGSVNELTSVSIGGHEQWIQMRGASPDKPVLLWLAGGPGQSDLAYTRVLFADLKRDFIVVDWDQRGTGKSHSALDPTSTLTLDQAVADTVELTNYLRERFDERKIYLAGESWGTTLGVLAVQRNPELYFAWIGSGQMVSERETDLRTYRDLLALARRSDDRALVDELEALGEPPYDDMLAYTLLQEHYDDLIPEYTAPQAYRDLGNGSGIGPMGILGSEYTLVDKVNVLAGLMDTFAVMYPQLQEIDFRQDVPRLDVPVYLMQGRHEMPSRDGIAREWFAQVQAPHKGLFTIENAGHSAAYEGYAEFHRIMVEVVLPATYVDG